MRNAHAHFLYVCHLSSEQLLFLPSRLVSCSSLMCQQMATLQLPSPPSSGSQAFSSLHLPARYARQHLEQVAERLHAGLHLVLLDCHLEESVDAVRRVGGAVSLSILSIPSINPESRTHIVTAMRIPVPLPSAPMRSAATESAPIVAPPNAAAVGMTLLSSLYMLWSLWPAMTIC